MKPLGVRVQPGARPGALGAAPRGRREVESPEVSPAALRSLYVWGGMSLLGVIFFLFGGAIGSFDSGNYLKYLLVDIVLFLGVALGVFRVPIRVPAAMQVLILLQIWLTACTIYATITLARVSEFSVTDYSLVAGLLAYLLATVVARARPEVRGIAYKILLYATLASGLLSILQFVGFGPEIAVANRLIKNVESIENWGGTTGIRASGIWPSVGVTGFMNLAFVGAMAAAAMRRRLTRFEWALVGLATISVGLVQVRSFAPSALVIYGVFTYVCARRYGPKAYAGAALFLCLAVLVVARNPERFGYIMSTFQGGAVASATFDFRRDQLWPQALNIIERHPWTGIGVEPSFAGFGGGLEDRFVRINILDSGWMVALAFGGIPALLILAALSMAGIASSCVALVRERFVDETHYVFGGFAAAAAITLVNQLFAGNTFTNGPILMFQLMLVGFGLPETHSLGRMLRISRNV